MKTVALYNLKGGVGKTTTAVNLAYLAAEQPCNTVLWDWDPQAAASWYYGVDKGASKAIRLLDKGVPVGSMEVATVYPRLTVVPADLSLRKLDTALANQAHARQLIRKLVAPLSETAAFLFFDCPPTLGPTIQHILSGTDLVLVPIIPSPMSIRAVEQIVNFFADKSHAPLHIVGFFCQVDQRRKLHRDILEKPAALPLPMLKTYIPADASIEQMAVRRAPLFTYTRQGKAAAAYRSLWQELYSLLSNLG